MIESLLVLVVLVVVAYLIVKKLSSRTQLNYWCACSTCMCMDVRTSHLSCRRRNRFWII